MKMLTRGQRGAKDIIEAAYEQGWRSRTAGGGAHLRMIPPNGGVPVGISGTPSDMKYRHTIIRLMRRSGFIWPWPPKEGASKNGKSMTNNIPTIEEWKPILGMEGLFELSRCGGVRKRLSGKRLLVKDGKVKLFDSNKQMMYEKDVADLVRLHFGHEPLQTMAEVNDGPTVENHRVSQIIEPKETDNQESNDMTIQAQSLGLPVEPLGSSPVKNGEKTPDIWRKVSLPDISDGYKVSRLGEVRSRLDRVLEPAIAGISLWVSLRRADVTGWQTRATRVDKLVLLAFVGEPSDGQDIPVHEDGDNLNCALDNLSWGFPGDQKRINDKLVAQAKAKSEPEPEPAPAPVSIEQAVEAGIDDYTELPPEPPLGEPVVPVEAKTRRERLLHHSGFPNAIPIADLDLTVKTYNVLTREGLITTGKIAAKRAYDLLDIRNFGERGIAEVKVVLGELGLYLQPDPPESTYDYQEAEQHFDERYGVDYVTPNGGTDDDEVEEIRVLRYDGITVSFEPKGEFSTDIKVTARSLEALQKILGKLS